MIYKYLGQIMNDLRDRLTGQPCRDDGLFENGFCEHISILTNF